MTTSTRDTESRNGSARRGTGDRQPHLFPRQATLRTIPRLQAGYRHDVPAAVAAVARLRREAGRDVYSSPTGWGLDHLEALTHLREEQRQRDEKQHEGQPAPQHVSSTYRERAEREAESQDQAVHLAVTLWALHQQSLRDEPMHVSGWPLGRAVRRLAHGKTGVQDPPTAPNASREGAEDKRGDSEPVEEISATVRKRFVRIGTSTDLETLGVRLREMVLLLRASRIPLDYGLLADQLYLWQDENRRDDARRAWGREFHFTYGKNGGRGSDEGSTPPLNEVPLDFTSADAGD
ncbi:type I-E CRISPR-associated protein Cse2/CasB [Streptomyces sp. WMMC1477]|uniref:type I-E CRISPR-associated protein Cse2/CasB n=1 Tax=Streptomyces sp. WMMC1477 TaxID=3015155 RepID=UPI0022B5E533|nr:type I-E CRISPR-associated protein Cse2/CasB [Streptomyces sp. WMMC1477]MCZ7432310.1 type I-E CRISPR-associated protein Cse2/CasB [Streptomyces sp. WMMC1477]